MPLTVHVRRRCPAALILLVIACGSGCTSVLSTASLRDLVWDGGEPHAAESATAASDGEASEADGDEASPADAIDKADSQALDTERREAAIEEAVERLAKLGSIGEAARATLVETLERTAPEDWPAVVEAFAESLPPEAHVAAKADLDASAAAEAEATPESPPEPESVATTSSTPADDDAPIVTVAVTASPEPIPDTPPQPAAPPIAPAPADAALTVENACFATRVQAWGVVERFAADRFRPGQEVIVYFELAGLSASESSAGHTTCIDSTLRLVAADGTVLHTWTFEPIAETCRAQRHDYFARYVVRLPETAAAGACRIELGVTDTLSGKVASATLPLELVSPLAAR
ncbi:MAG: hypothetical protein ACKO1M_10805 [Planctomycetota bacterium]